MLCKGSSDSGGVGQSGKVTSARSSELKGDELSGNSNVGTYVEGGGHVGGQPNHPQGGMV